MSSGREHQSDLRMSYWGNLHLRCWLDNCHFFPWLRSDSPISACVCVCNLHFTINFAYTVPGEIRTKNRNRVSSKWSVDEVKYERRNQNGVSTQNKNSHTPQCERVYMSITRTSFSFRHAHTHTEFFLLFPYSVLSFLSLFVHSLRTIPVNGSNGRKHINSTWLLPHTQEHKGRRKDVVFVTHSRIYSRIQKGGPSPIYSHTKYTSHISPPPKKNTNNTRAQEMRQCVTLHASLVNGRIHTYIDVKVSQR